MTTTIKAPPQPLALRRDREGWWMYVGHFSPDEWWGPWSTKGEAEEARRSWRRNNISALRPCEIKSEWRRRRKPLGAK
jgi:hypothetical protein